VRGIALNLEKQQHVRFEVPLQCPNAIAMAYTFASPSFSPVYSCGVTDIRATLTLSGSPYHPQSPFKRYLFSYLLSIMVSWGPNRLDAFIIGTDGTLHQRWWDGSQWNGFLNLGGSWLFEPVTISRKPNTLDVFLVGTNHSVYVKSWDGSTGGWSDFKNLGGVVVAPPAVTSRQSEYVDVFVIGLDHAM